MPSDELILRQTRYWVEEVIVKHNFCPFARKEVLCDSIQYTVCRPSSSKDVLQALQQLYQHLDTYNQVETSLLIIAEQFTEFDPYLDLVDLAEAELISLGYQGTYQLASFHPEYQFAGSTLDDPANYTNRFLYPLIHIIREASIEKVLAHVDNPEAIPQRNIQYCQELGLAQMRAMLAACQLEK